MKFSDKKEANRITITVEVSRGYNTADQRVRYRFGDIEPILRERYDLENYNLIVDESTAVLSNFTATHIGNYVFEKTVVVAKQAPVKKPKKTIVAKKTK